MSGGRGGPCDRLDATADHSAGEQPESAWQGVDRCRTGRVTTKLHHAELLQNMAVMLFMGAIVIVIIISRIKYQ